MIDLTLPLIILLVALGTGVLSALVGVGGGFIMVSFMLAYMGLRTQTAVGTSAFVIIFSAISASVAYFRQKRIDYRIGIIAASLSVPAAILGGYATNFIASSQLALLFAIALLIVGIKMVFFPREKSKDVGPRDEKKAIPADRSRRKSSATRDYSGHRLRTEIIDAMGNKFVYIQRCYQPFHSSFWQVSSLACSGSGEES